MLPIENYELVIKKQKMHEEVHEENLILKSRNDCDIVGLQTIDDAK